MEDEKFLKNRERAFKLIAGGATIAMLFTGVRAGLTQLKINEYLDQKEALLSKYETTAPNNTLEYFRANATNKELEEYNTLEDEEKASKIAQRDDLTTAGAMLVVLGATGYTKLLNDEMIAQDKKLEAIKTARKAKSESEKTKTLDEKEM